MMQLAVDQEGASSANTSSASTALSSEATNAAAAAAAAAVTVSAAGSEPQPAVAGFVFFVLCKSVVWHGTLVLMLILTSEVN